MKKYNVVIVGGGSHRNPDLMAMLADNKDRFPIRRICLYDTELKIPAFLQNCFNESKSGKVENSLLNLLLSICRIA